MEARTISQDELKKILHYDPLTGIFTATIDRYRAKSGNILGGIQKTGIGNYKRIRIIVRGKAYFGHKLAFLYMLGVIPKRIDHIDLNPLNNRWDNLRESTPSQNTANSNVRNTNKCGYKGVTRAPATCKVNKWRASITVHYRSIHLGVFPSKEEAAKAYDVAALEYFGEFARLNFPVSEECLK